MICPVCDVDHDGPGDTGPSEAEIAKLYEALQDTIQNSGCQACISVVFGALVHLMANGVASVDDKEIHLELVAAWANDVLRWIPRYREVIQGGIGKTMGTA